MIKNSDMLNRSEENYLNTINCLCFAKTNENEFLVGSRDGIAKMYDLRADPSNKGSLFKFRAHNNKLNQIIYNSTDRLLLSSGRDNTIRLWDVRMLRDDISDYTSYEK